MAELQTNTGKVRRYRPLTSADKAQGLELSSEAGWNQNAADWDLLMQVCRGWGAERTDGRLIGTTMAWQPTATQAWINMVLVAARSRGQGVARKLMEALLRECDAAGRTAVLDATAMGEGLYRKLGFGDGPQLLRLLGKATPADAVKNVAGLRRITAADLDAVTQLDRSVFGADRRSMLDNFFQRYPQGAWLIESASGELLGFVVARDGLVATQLGPLVAQDLAQAEALLRRALVEIKGAVFLDVPKDNLPWLDLVQALGFTVQRGFTRMTRGERTMPTDWSRYFAISGPDFA